jgi:predicted dehydrogenase
VCTPPRTHVPLTLDALDAGAHVVCEKPVALAADELDAVLARAAATGRHVVEDHNYRFNAPALAIEAALASGELGAVRDVDVRLSLDVRSGGRFADEDLPSDVHALPAGVVHDFVTHLAYLGLRFAGVDRFERVDAVWGNHGGGIFRYDDLDATLVSRPVHVRLRFSAQTPPDELAIAVRGTRGSMECELFRPVVRRTVPRAGGGLLSPYANAVVGGLGAAAAGVRGLVGKVLQQSPYEGMRRFLGLVYDGLARGGPMPVTPGDMTATAAVIEAMLGARVPA